MRLDIEGLRALAVVLVLCYHYQLGPFHGGYIGVDVFFVVSGFLITRLLLTELDRTGFIALPRFWARRARRLLPASSLVIVVTLLGGLLVLDPLSVTDLARDAVAAATFVINIVFAHQQNDYLASEQGPSPLLHFWSLALEEQFYLFWPLLLQLLAGYRRHARARVAGLVVVLWPLSFLACVLLTRSNQPWAFFGLPTRAWELLTGAGLALVAALALRVPGLIRAVVAWAGLVTIVVVALDYDTATAFPGPGALVPVLATVAVLAAGPTALLGPVTLLRLRPLVWIGQRSYGIYLWHWPALVLATARFGPLAAWERTLVLLYAVAIAAVTFKVFEDPIRHSTWLAAKARRGLMMGGALIAVAVGASLFAESSTPALVGTDAAAAPVLLTGTTAPAVVTGVTSAPVTMPPTSAPATATARSSSTSGRPVTGDPGASAAPAAPAGPAESTSAPVTTTPTTVLGPAELAALNATQIDASLATQEVPANLRPALRAARGDLPAIYDDGCHLDAAATMPGPCTFGDPTSDTTVVLFGDSHAAQWFPAMQQIADQHRWRLVVMTKKGCPTASISVFSPMVNRELRECDAWRVNVADRLAAEHPALIVMSSYRYRQTGAWAGVESNQAWREGLGITLDALVPLAGEVLVLGDTPTPANDVPACVSSHLRNVGACVAPRAEAVRDDRLAVEQEVSAAHGARFTPTSDWLCTANGCPVIVGDVLVYRDANHITATAAAWLSPYLDAAVTPLAP